MNGFHLVDCHAERGSAEKKSRGSLGRGSAGAAGRVHPRHRYMSGQPTRHWIARAATSLAPKGVF